MKALFFCLSLLALVATSMNASADWGHGGPGWGGGGPGWGHGGDHGGWHHGPGWGPGGPGHGPGWGPGPGYPPPPPPQPRVQYVSCSSDHYAFSSCPVYGYIQSAQLVSQDSMASCNLGQSWGYQQNSIWVNNGCRGTFAVYLY